MKKLVKRIPNRILLIWALIVPVVLLCSSSGYGSAFPRQVTGLDGKNLKIKSPPARIITLGPSVTEVAFSLVSSRRITAVSNASNYPPETAKKEKVGEIYLNYEKIVSLEPDLVLVESTLYPRAGDRLRRLGVPILVIQSDSYDNFIKSLKTVGLALGEEKKADRLLEKLENNLSLIADRIRAVPQGRRPRVFIEIWNEPLMTAGSGTFINYVVKKAGGINIASDLTGYPQLNLETLLVRNPDIIILTTSCREDFIGDRRLRNIQAVKSGRVYNINPDILVRHTLRLFEGCRTLYNFFYPDTRISAGYGK